MVAASVAVVVDELVVFRGVVSLVDVVVVLVVVLVVDNVVVCNVIISIGVVSVMFGSLYSGNGEAPEPE